MGGRAGVDEIDAELGSDRGSTNPRDCAIAHAAFGSTFGRFRIEFKFDRLIRAS